VTPPLTDPLRRVVARARRRRSGTRDALERVYATEYDPYHSIDNAYEATKYADVLRVVEGHRSSRGLEVGCAVGQFTEQLAGVCDELVAIDISAQAVERTRERVAALPNVRVLRGTAPDELPSGPFDLVVCSDVLYYLPARRLRRALDQLASLLAPGGALVSLHWLGDFGGPTSGDQVHDQQAERWRSLQHVSSDLRAGVGPDGAGYRLDRYDRPRAG
jgi:SAM-dependent methyltransferase